MPFSNDPYGFFPPSNTGPFASERPVGGTLEGGFYGGQGAEGLMARRRSMVDMSGGPHMFSYQPGDQRGGFRSPGYYATGGGPMLGYGPRRNGLLWAADEQPMGSGPMSFAQWNRWNQQQQEQQQMQQQMQQQQQLQQAAMARQQMDMYQRRPYDPSGAYFGAMAAGAGAGMGGAY